MSGEKRRDRNEKHDVYTPPLVIPEEGIYLWEWYEQLSGACPRVIEGRCQPIPPSEVLAWMQLTGNIVWSSEYAILMKMDRAYCEEMNLELESDRQRREDEEKQRIERERTAGKRGRKGRVGS